MLKKAGDFNKALELFDRAAEEDPENAALFNNRGIVHARMKSHDKAIEDFTRALSIDPDNAGTYCNRGMVHEEKGDLEHAMKDYDGALRKDASYVPALLNRAALENRRGQPARAVDDLRIVLGVEKHNVKAMTLLGTIYLKDGSSKEALRWFHQALRYNPECTEAAKGGGDAYFMRGRFERAVEAYDKALESAGKEAPEILANRCSAQIRLRAFDKAIEDCEASLRLSPKRAHVHFNLANAYTALGRSEDALEALNKAISREPERVGLPLQQRDSLEEPREKCTSN